MKSARRANGASSPGAKWIINDGADGEFDAIIVTVGTCGKPKMAAFPGMPHTHWDDEKEESKNKDGRDSRSSGRPDGWRLPQNPANRPKGSDSPEKAAEKRRKEDERRRKEQQANETRRRTHRDMDETEFNPDTPVASLFILALHLILTSFQGPADFWRSFVR